MEAQFETMTNKYEARIEALENENNSLLEAVTSFEDKFAGVSDLKEAIEMIQKHIASMGESQEENAAVEEDEEMAHTPEHKEEEEKEEMKDDKYEATEEVAEEVSEEFTAEEEATEAEVEEQFAAEQKAEEVEETVEDKTVVFNGITSEKVDMINNFFNRK